MVLVDLLLPISSACLTGGNDLMKETLLKNSMLQCNLAHVNELGNRPLIKPFSVSCVTAGHESESEAGVCKNGETERGEILSSAPWSAPDSKAYIAFDFGYLGDLTS